MTFDFSDKSVGELENLVQNYRSAGKTDSDFFIEALRALELRRRKGLDLQKTLELALGAARSRKFVAYKQVAEASGLAWTSVHWDVGEHLGALCEYAHRKGFPLLSAIVVNVDGIETGEMKPESRAGFVKAARSLNFVVVNEEEFVRAEQEKVFVWAAGEAV